MDTKTFPAKIDHGRRGRIRVFSEWNTDREPSSRQVWVEFQLRGKVLGTSSSNLVTDLERVDLDSGPIPAGVTGDLMPEEIRFVDSIHEEFEGRDH